MTIKHRSDCWDSGNSLTRYIEEIDYCTRCGQKVDITGIFNWNGLCTYCEEEEFRIRHSWTDEEDE